MKIVVENLADTVTEDELLGLFGMWSEVKSVMIETDKINGMPAGFVEIPDRQEALDAIKKIDGIDLFGEPLKLSIMREETDRRADDDRRLPQDRREVIDRRTLINRRSKSELISSDSRSANLHRRTGLDRRDFYDRRIVQVRRSGIDRR